jgi:hypothetical protein
MISLFIVSQPFKTCFQILNQDFLAKPEMVSLHPASTSTREKQIKNPKTTEFPMYPRVYIIQSSNSESFHIFEFLWLTRPHIIRREPIRPISNVCPLQ